jgi:hypothetical protein
MPVRTWLAHIWVFGAAAAQRLPTAGISFWAAVTAGACLMR